MRDTTSIGTTRNAVPFTVVGPASRSSVLRSLFGPIQSVRQIRPRSPVGSMGKQKIRAASNGAASSPSCESSRLCDSGGIHPGTYLNRPQQSVEALGSLPFGVRLWRKAGHPKRLLGVLFCTMGKSTGPSLLPRMRRLFEKMSRALGRAPIALPASRRPGSGSRSALAVEGASAQLTH
jgi:hypothetical protein